tara:strand:- start:6175 stop:7185 length:1011 start_codon:yes stop_codon:yes gene_type:complete
MKKVIITDHFKEAKIEKKILGKDVNIICLQQPDENKFSSEIENADCLLVWHANLTEKTFKKLKKCKSIIRYGVGMDNIDVKSAKKFKINCANNPDYGTDEVADTTCSMMLSLNRKIFLYNNKCQFYQNGWQENVVKENVIEPVRRSSKINLGIIGLGRIGSAVAHRMKAFKMKIGFYDPYIKNNSNKLKEVKKFDDLDDLLKTSDIISINCTLTDETKGMVNKSFVNKMKESSILVNTARGAIIDKLDTVYEALENKRLAGVGLDVLPDEPPSNHEKLLKVWKDKKNPLSDKIIINPHAAYYSSTSGIEMRSKAAENAARSLKGIRIKNIVKVKKL